VTEASSTPSLGRRLRSAALLVVVAIFVPVGLSWAIQGFDAVRGSAIGAVLGLLLCLRTGWRRALLTVPPLLLALGLGIVSAGGGAWVVLLAMVGFVTGLLARWGAAASGALVGVVAATTLGLADSAPLASTLVAAGMSAVFAAVVVRQLGLPPDVPDPELTLSSSLPLALILGFVAAGSAAVALAWDDAFDYWLPMLVFVLVVPTPGVRFSRAARSRVLGTGVGASIALVLAAAGVPEWARLLGGLGLLLLVLAVTEPRWVNAAFSTLLVLLVLDPTGVGSPDLVASRVAATLLAVTVVATGALALGLLGWRRELLEEEREALRRAQQAQSPDIVSDGLGA
jgi:hypothetical protein